MYKVAKPLGRPGNQYTSLKVSCLARHVLESEVGENKAGKMPDSAHDEICRDIVDRDS